MDPYAEKWFPEALRVLTKLREKKFETYFAGGYYRDRVLGREPNDVDIATSAKPEEVRALFTRTIPVGEQFGIVIVQMGQERVEVATFREDVSYEDGRRPTAVRYSTAEADARRRDFTINGVFWDPVAEKPFDFIGGQGDLLRGIVRAIGEPDARFDEDKLRILRAPRFAARLGFRIEERTRESARRRRAEVAIVSSERIRDELDKMLQDPNRARALDLVRELDVASVVLPELDLAHLDRARAVLAALPARKLPRVLVWSALLVGQEPARVTAILERLRHSNQDRDAIVALVKDEPRARAPGELRLAEQKRLLLRADAPTLLDLARAVALATTGDLEGVRMARARREAFLEEKGVTALASPPLLRGNDLRDLGLKPGPRFKELLAFSEEERLEGRATNRDELMARLRAARPDLLT